MLVITRDVFDQTDPQTLNLYDRETGKLLATISIIKVENRFANGRGRAKVGIEADPDVLILRSEIDRPRIFDKIQEPT